MGDKGDMKKDVHDANPNPVSDTDARYGQGFGGISSKVQGRKPVQRTAIITEAELNSSRYKMDHGSRGKALIINNKEFKGNMGLGDRKGTDVDAAVMYQRLQELDFDVTLEHNLSADKIQQILLNLSLEDHNDCDCLFVVVLSHGEEGVVFGTEGSVEVKKLFEPFKGNRCPSLAGKPKIFAIQACRGCQFDDGMDVTVADAEGMMEIDQTVRTQSIPAEADFLVAYSVVPGFYSWRNSTNGSWFIQALSVALQDKKLKDLDFLRLLTVVNRKVAYQFQSQTSDPRMALKKQIPCITSMLTKEIYFTPK
ncbi:caspase-3-like [Mizuhopecten yessoensis]|uniref:Caspase-3 n=1 Tax=Mizuhopecten yessoensis TaxID=6573 RepID=A0A210R6I0_MIZYE|nr:caspase-3-like [Mizuhopecten yessoensis]OWF56528.1 Caspase-3 [Mizuhopecten yessoensis]